MWFKTIQGCPPISYSAKLTLEMVIFRFDFCVEWSIWPIYFDEQRKENEITSHKHQKWTTKSNEYCSRWGFFFWFWMRSHSQRPHTAKCTRFLSQIWTRLMLDDAFWLKSRLRSWLNSDFVWAKSGPIIPKGEVTVSDEFAWLLMVWRDDVDGMVVSTQIIYCSLVCFCSNAAVCEISTITWHRRQLLFSSTI